MTAQCDACFGRGEIETCGACANSTDVCECEDDSIPMLDMEECSECEGTGLDEAARAEAAFQARLEALAKTPEGRARLTKVMLAFDALFGPVKVGA